MAAALLLLVVELLLPAAAVDTATEILIVRSSDAQPYAQAGEAVRLKLAKLDRKAEILNLADLTANSDETFKACITAGNVKLFVAIGTQAAEWLHTHVPEPVMLLYCMVADPAAIGLNKGRSTYGISTTIGWNEQRGLIRAALPQARKIGVLYAKKDPASKAAMESLRSQLGENDQLTAVAIDESDSISDAIDTLMNSRPDIIWTTADSAVFTSATVRALLLAALRHKIPVFGFSTPFVRAGALFGVGIDPDQQGRQCGDLCASFLTAVKNNQEPEFRKRERIVAPQFQIAINQIVAKQLDRPLPDDFTARASVIIKSE